MSQQPTAPVPAAQFVSVELTAVSYVLGQNKSGVESVSHLGVFSSSPGNMVRLPAN